MSHESISDLGSRRNQRNPEQIRAKQMEQLQRDRCQREDVSDAENNLCCNQSEQKEFAPASQAGGQSHHGNHCPKRRSRMNPPHAHQER